MPLQAEILPILYSFRRCPFAIRARMALSYAGIQVELREVQLRNKPDAMLTASSKGTVPVLVTPNASVIDESVDIMRWALAQNDPESWLDGDNAQATQDLVMQCDLNFKTHLDHYKYADRHPQHSKDFYRQQAAVFLSKLEQRLSQAPYLMGQHIGFADVAIFPFIRQFAFVDKSWFDQAPYPHLQTWLESFLGSVLFLDVMTKYAPWQESKDHE